MQINQLQKNIYIATPRLLKRVKCDDFDQYAEANAGHSYVYVSNPLFNPFFSQAVSRIALIISIYCNVTHCCSVRLSLTFSDMHCF